MSPDTTKEAHDKQREIIFSKSVSERFLMGLEMSDFGWQLAIDNIKQHPTSEPLKVELIKRMYKNDFDAEEFKKVLEYFRKSL